MSTDQQVVLNYLDRANIGAMRHCGRWVFPCDVRENEKLASEIVAALKL